MKNIFFYNTKIGKIGIAESKNYITNLYFETDTIPDDMILEESIILKEAAKQLNRYLSGEQKSFALPIKYHGTEFMKSVWEALCGIPYGKTVSYKDLAKTIGNENSSRAVGNANNKNPIPIFIPCHRVIGSNGKLTGYRGGLEVKKYLLDLEK